VPRWTSCKASVQRAWYKCVRECRKGTGWHCTLPEGTWGWSQTCKLPLLKMIWSSCTYMAKSTQIYFCVDNETSYRLITHKVFLINAYRKVTIRNLPHSWHCWNKNCTKGAHSTLLLRKRRAYLQPPDPTSLSQKNNKQLGEGWNPYRSTGQLRQIERGSTSKLPLATSRATNPRQQWLQDPAKFQRKPSNHQGQVLWAF